MNAKPGLHVVALFLGAVASLAPLESHGYAGGEREFDWGFLASRKITEEGQEIFRAAGPLWESRSHGAGASDDFRAFRPFYSYERSVDRERIWTDLLWPLVTHREIEDDVTLRFLLAKYINFDKTNPDSAWRFWLVPLYFQGRSDKGEDYWALFPLYGTIRGFAFQDQVSFQLFPVHFTSSINEVRSEGWFWPLYSRTEGDGVDRLQLFPFYGRSVRDNDYDKRYILWPFYTHAEYGSEQGEGTAWILFPLVGRVQLEAQDGWWILPPLFRFHRGEQQNLIYAPWPFIQMGSGEIDRLYLWPIWGKRQIGNETKYIFAWPLGRWLIHDDQHQRSSLFHLWPFLFWDDVSPVQAETPSRSYRKIWPLFSYARQGDRSRFRMLDLWPGRGLKAVERNWAPLWTIYEHNRQEEQVETEVLWGFFRHRQKGEESTYWSLFPLIDRKVNREENEKEWNLLKGLIGGGREDGHRYMKLFYLKFGGSEK